MWELFRRYANQYLNENATVTAAIQNEKMDLAPFDSVVLGGGSLIAPSYISFLYNAMMKNKPVSIWGSGLDKLAGRVGLTCLLRNKPIPASLISQDTKDKITAILNGAQFASVRGPLSHSFLCQLGADPVKLRIGGDPAFLLKPEDAADTFPGERILSRNQAYVGINWGTANNQIYGKNEAYVEDQLALAAKFLINKGYRILMIVVWPKDIPSTERLMDKINMPGKVHLIDSFSPYEHLAAMKLCRFTINFKLHASIFSAVMRVPFIALGYRFKVFDFGASIASLPFVIPTDSPKILGDIVRLTGEIEKDRPSLIRSMDKELRRYDGRLTDKFFHSLNKE